MHPIYTGGPRGSRAAAAIQQQDEAKRMATEILEKVATVDDVRREVSRMKSMVTEAVNDGVRSALRAIETGREYAEDALYDARRATKRSPLQALGVAFAAGAVMCGLAVWISSRGR
jgi:t-SNARE complex subunit (syntaxin)